MAQSQAGAEPANPTQMTSTVHIVDTTHANVGELVAILSAVGMLECARPEGEGLGNPGAADVSQRAGATTDRRLMAHYRRIPAGFGSA